VLLQLAAASATQLNDFPRAMAYLARIDEASLDNPSVLADAAVNLINKRRSADGIAVLDRVIARFPDAPDPYFYRGFAKAQASQNAEAKVDLEKYLTLAPADSPQAAKAREILASLK
jgi:predicted Zn-dependent protease